MKGQYLPASLIHQNIGCTEEHKNYKTWFRYRKKLVLNWGPSESDTTISATHALISYPSSCSFTWVGYSLIWAIDTWHDSHGNEVAFPILTSSLTPFPLIPTPGRMRAWLGLSGGISTASVRGLEPLEWIPCEFSPFLVMAATENVLTQIQWQLVTAAAGL